MQAQELTKILNGSSYINKTGALPVAANAKMQAQELTKSLNGSSSINKTEVPLHDTDIGDINSNRIRIADYSPEVVGRMIKDDFINTEKLILATDEVRKSLYVSVLPPITATEHFVNFWTGWGGFVGLIAGSFVGLAGLIFSRRSRSSGN